MTSIQLHAIKQDESHHPNHQPVNLPRFNKDFIGIGHQLQQKKKERRKAEEEERAMANRVIFLQKEEIRAQQSLKKKKSELNKMVETIERTNQQKQQKQHLRRIKQLQLEALREENRTRRLQHQEAQQNALYTIESEKHNTFSRIKSFIKEKQQQKKDFLFDDMKQKKDKWLSLNLDKEKGKQKIDLFYKKKNTEATLTYMQMIEKEERTKMEKIGTMKQLEVFQSALRKKLEESSSRISQVQQKILQNSRTLEVRRSTSQQPQRNEAFHLPHPTPSQKRASSHLSSYTIHPSAFNSSAFNPQQSHQLNISFQKLQQHQQQQSNPTQKQRAHGSLTSRQRTSSKQNNNDDEIQEKIEYPNVDEIQMSAFQIIRTVKRKKKNLSNRKDNNRYREYRLL